MRTAKKISVIKAWERVCTASKGHALEDARWVLALWLPFAGFNILSQAYGAIAERPVLSLICSLIELIVITGIEIGIMDKMAKRLDLPVWTDKGILWPLTQRRVWTNMLLILAIGVGFCLLLFGFPFLGLLPVALAFLILAFLSLCFVSVITLMACRLQRTGCEASLMESLYGFGAFILPCLRWLLLAIPFAFAEGAIYWLLMAGLRLEEGMLTARIVQMFMCFPLMFGIGIWYVPRYYGCILLVAEELEM